MAASKRVNQRILSNNKDFSLSTNTLIENLVTTPINISRTPENHLNISNSHEPIQIKQIVEISQLKTTVTDKVPLKTINDDDEWVCPIAVALRKAGYNVPLRPSKSWLERDRKKQALLRDRQTSFKEM